MLLEDMGCILDYTTLISSRFTSEMLFKLSTTSTTSKRTENIIIVYMILGLHIIMLLS